MEVAIPLLYTVTLLMPFLLKRPAKQLQSADGNLAPFVSSLLKVFHRFVHGSIHGLAKSVPQMTKNANSPRDVSFSPQNELTSAAVKQKLVLANSCLRELLHMLYLLFPCSLMKFIGVYCIQQFAYFEMIEVRCKFLG